MPMLHPILHDTLGGVGYPATKDMAVVRQMSPRVEDAAHARKQVRMACIRR